MSDDAPDWLLTMRAMSGQVVETPGSGNNPKIMGMADEIGRIWSDMKTYCDQYRADATPWCGLACAYVVSKANIRPPFVAGNDTDCFLWARSWADDPNYDLLKVPRLGCIVVLTRSGGGHVSLYESTTSDGNSYRLRGGNQSDAINVSTFPRSSVIALAWPKDAPAPPPIEPPAEAMPVLRRGDTGAAVAHLQSLLPWVDGDFGSATESTVKDFQRSQGLEADGVVGPDTWAALLDEEPPQPPLPPAVGWMHGITATVFGNFEGEQSAYGGQLNDSEPFVALPYRFPSGTRPDVEVMNEDGEIFVGTIEDVGPWMIDDRAYVMDGKRPVAEQCYASKTPLPRGPQKGRVPTNPAGLDLSPALAKLLGIQGMGKVSWRLVL